MSRFAGGDATVVEKPRGSGRGEDRPLKEILSAPGEEGGVAIARSRGEFFVSTVGKGPDISCSFDIGFHRFPRSDLLGFVHWNCCCKVENAGIGAIVQLIQQSKKLKIETDRNDRSRVPLWQHRKSVVGKVAACSYTSKSG